VNGATSVHKNPMKETPTVKKEVAEKSETPAASYSMKVEPNIQLEIYLRLISSAAADGRFLLGNLPNAQAVVKQGDHLKGVSELLAKCYEK
jgi:hypothetical protein